MTKARYGISGSVLLLATLAFEPQGQAQEPNSTAPVKIAAPAAIQPYCFQPGITKVASVGYGATSTLPGLSPGQKKLLGIRASKVDAYRALAEQVAGVHVNTQSTVAEMMAKNDFLRLSVEAEVRGARVVSVSPMSDGNYETILEVELDNQFYANACQAGSGVAVMAPSVTRSTRSEICGARCSTPGGSFYYGE
jgi:hypothetical protein